MIYKIKYLLQKNKQFRNVNFEYIINLLDKVVDYLSSSMPSEYGNIDEILIDFWQHNDSQLKQYAFRNSNNDGWGYVPFLARELLAAAIIGLRYGDGDIYLKNGYSRKVHWQGPSIGFDWGGNASKVFTLVYNLPSVESVFQRFPGVDGSLYFIGGGGVNYVQRDGIVLAPIRLGVGWRVGANVGYLKVTPEKTWNPF